MFLPSHCYTILWEQIFFSFVTTVVSDDLLIFAVMKNLMKRFGSHMT